MTDLERDWPTIEALWRVARAAEMVRASIATNKTWSPKLEFNEEILRNHLIDLDNAMQALKEAEGDE